MCGRPSRTLFARRHEHAAGFDRVGRAVRCDDLEAARDQQLRARSTRTGLVAVAHADQAHAARRQHDARGRLRLRIRLAEAAARAHDLAGRLHLRAEDRIGIGKFREREHRLP